MVVLSGLLFLIISKVVNSKKETVAELPPRLPDTYKDIFAGGNGKPTLGNTAATCWARGGICVDIKDCPDLVMDIGVPGCAWGFRVCCQMLKFGSPTVGIKRSLNDAMVSSIHGLEENSLEEIARRNYIYLIDNYVDI